MAGIPNNILAYNTESMETDVSSWSVLANSTLAQSTNFAAEGTHSMSVTSTAAGVASAIPISADFPAATAGTIYQFSFWVYSTVSGLQVTGNQFDWYNGTTFVQAGGSLTVNLTQNGWTQVKIIALAPATTTLARIYPSFTATAGSQVCYIDEVYFGPPIMTAITQAASPARRRHRRYYRNQAPPPGFYQTTITNDFETGTNGTQISTANTGGPGDTAFDLVTVSASQTFAFDNSISAHGGLSAKVSTNGSSLFAYGRWGASLCNGNPNLPTVWIRTYLNVGGAYPSGNYRFAAWFETASGGTLCTQFVIQSTGKIAALDAGGTIRATSAITIPLNTWVRVEGLVTGSATNGQIEFKIWSTSMDSSGTPDDQQTTSATLNTGGLLGSVELGQSASTTVNATYWMDDIGASSQGYIGPVPTSNIVNVTASIAGVGTCGAVPTLEDPNPTLTGAGSAGIVPGISNSAAVSGAGSVALVTPDIDTPTILQGTGSVGTVPAIGGGGQGQGSGSMTTVPDILVAASVGAGTIIQDEGSGDILDEGGGVILEEDAVDPLVVIATSGVIISVSALLVGTGSCSSGQNTSGGGSTASIGGVGTATATPTIGVFGPIAGAGSIANVVPDILVSSTAAGSGSAGGGGNIGVFGPITGTGSATEQPIIGAAGHAVGAGSEATVPDIVVSSALTGSGSSGSGGGLGVFGPLTGTGTAGETPNIDVLAKLVATGSAIPVPIISALAAISALGSATSGIQFELSASITGTGTAGAVPIISVSALLQGSGSMTGQGGGTGGLLQGSGSANALPDIGVLALLQGAGSATASAFIVIQVLATLVGTGTAGAVPDIVVPASAQGQGTATATATVSFVFVNATAAITGTGSAGIQPILAAQPVALTPQSVAGSGARLGLGCQLSGQGSITCTGGTHAQNVPATGSTTVTDPRDGHATVANLVSGQAAVSDPHEGHALVSAVATGKTTVRAP